MLRITVVNELRATRFKLEGKLAHEWVVEAAAAWTTLAALHGGQEIVIDLLDVSFVDDLGGQLLSQMHQAGARLVGSGPMISALITEIEKSDTAD